MYSSPSNNSTKISQIRILTKYLCLTLLLIYIGLLHIKIPPRIIIRTLSLNETMTQRLPVETMCYASDGVSYQRNHLRKVYRRRAGHTSAYVAENDSLSITYITKNFTDFSEFVNFSRTKILSRRLINNSRSIETIFRNPRHRDMVTPSCDGLWMEFGVFSGTTLRHIADWKRIHCGNNSQSVYGFDTFTGLPGDWRAGFKRGLFALPNGTKILVPNNTVLVKGLFIDTLPIELLRFDQQSHCHTPVSFVHIDCDLYEGTKDVLFLLGNRFVTGTILVFDELFNYPGYEQHELKALFEFLSGSNIRLIPVGSSTDISLHPEKDALIQSFAFIVSLE
ncbi:hypothetical protein I4U23_015106 [Adineta vaga]|nr:hypothetical protein I4U23_015106 [Adineta vaga]